MHSIVILWLNLCLAISHALPSIWGPCGLIRSALCQPMHLQLLMGRASPLSQCKTKKSNNKSHPSVQLPSVRTKYPHQTFTLLC